MFNTEYMKIALNQAKKAANEGNEVPVGAVLCSADNKILAQTHNLCEKLYDISAHAEILAIREASKKLKTSRLQGCKLWITLEPCPMCMAAISYARIAQIYFAATDPKSGGAFLSNHPSLSHKVEIFGGIMEDESKAILQDFFQRKRNSNHPS